MNMNFDETSDLKTTMSKYIELGNDYIKHSFLMQKKKKIVYDKNFLLLGREKYKGDLVGIDSKDAVRVLMIGVPGCLVENTKICTNNGIKSIQDIDADNDLIESFDFKEQKSVYSKFQLYDVGEKEVYKIETDNGIIECSEDHIWFVKRNKKIVEVKTKDLLETDVLISR